MVCTHVFVLIVFVPDSQCIAARHDIHQPISPVGLLVDQLGLPVVLAHRVTLPFSCALFSFPITPPVRNRLTKPAAS